VMMVTIVGVEDSFRLILYGVACRCCQRQTVVVLNK
jgi:hypothetical protein